MEHKNRVCTREMAEKETKKISSPNENHQKHSSEPLWSVLFKKQGEDMQYATWHPCAGLEPERCVCWQQDSRVWEFGWPRCGFVSVPHARPWPHSRSVQRSAAALRAGGCFEFGPGLEKYNPGNLPIYFILLLYQLFFHVYIFSQFLQMRSGLRFGTSGLTGFLHL